LRHSLAVPDHAPIAGMSGKWLVALLLAAAATVASIEDASAGDARVLSGGPLRLGMDSGERIATFLMSHGFFCLRATTLKRTIVRLDGVRTFRVACGQDGGPPIYLITMPPGQHLRQLGIKSASQ
jgi:hypothetical protein